MTTILLRRYCHNWALYDIILLLARKFGFIRVIALAWCGTKKAQWLLKTSASSILVFDLETTGIYTDRAEILQIAIANGNGSMLFSSYVKPKRRSWKVAERINGITPEMVKDAPTFPEIRDQVQKLFNQAKLIAGYNIKGFDIKIIERYGIVVPLKRFDVMEEFRLFTGRVIGFRLQDCAEYFHVSFKPHDAKEDASTTARCMQSLIHEQGFVKTGLPKKEKKSEGHQSNNNAICPEISPDVVTNTKYPTWKKLMKPLLKKHRFHPFVTGILLMAVSSCIIVYLIHGWDAASRSIIIEPADLIITITASLKNALIGAAFPVGAIMMLYGLLKSIIYGIRRIINLVRRIIT